MIVSVRDYPSGQSALEAAGLGETTREELTATRAP
jgi:hypothetical protein